MIQVAYIGFIDMNPTDGQQRKLTGIIMLNDDYSGGDLQFGMKDKDGRWISVPKKKGTITIFPSILSHRVSPLQKGTRYSIQEFYIGDSFVLTKENKHMEKDSIYVSQNHITFKKEK